MFLIKIWDVKTGLCIQTISHSQGINSISFSSDSKYIASGNKDNTIKIFEVKNGECLHTLQGHSNSVNSVSFDPNGKYIVSGSDDKTVKIWNIIDGTCEKTIEYPNPVTCVLYSPKGKYLAVTMLNILKFIYLENEQLHPPK